MNNFLTASGLIIGLVLLLVLLSALVLITTSWLLGWDKLKPLREWLARRRERRPKEGDRRSQSLISPGWVLSLLSLVCGGVAGIVLYATQFGSVVGIGVGAVATAIAAASLMAGAILGFLFGIPRSVQEDRNATGAADDNSGTSIGYRANTNLEQISDWLTKILVGVGLTQITKIDDAVSYMSGPLGLALGVDKVGAAAPAFGVAITLYFLQCGFLYGYVWARVVLARAFRAADVAALGREVAQQIEKKFELQNEIDARALNLTSRILDPQSGGEGVRLEELFQAIKDASPPVKVTIFELARAARKKGDDSEAAKQTIRIFEALIASSPDRYHRNYGQLGYALKSKPTPDWEKAEKALSNAIRLRGDWETHGYVIYEYNRAICRIRLDQAFPNSPASADVRARVIEDLKVVNREAWTRALMEQEPIADWMRLNAVTAGELV